MDWFSGTGAGGQYRNKHANCCRITHLESGLSTTGQTHRERPSNQKDAFTKLARLLIAHYCVEAAVRPDVSARVRTYHGARNQVIDHASGLTMPYKTVVGKTELGPLITARKMALGGAEERDATQVSLVSEGPNA